MRAILISIGNELTLGQCLDTNSPWLSQQLAAIGVPVRMHITVADDLNEIRTAIERAAREADVVILTGGLGPTEDDLTRSAMAAAMGVPLVLHRPSLDQIEAFFARRRRTMPEANRVQAMVPAGATPIENTCGTAPGLHAQLGGAEVFAMPGVPREMMVMYERAVRPALAARARGRILLTRTLHTYGAGESDIGSRLADLMQRGRNPAVGTTARQTVISVRICAIGDNPRQARDLLEADAAEIRRRLGELIFGEGDETLAEAVARLLKAGGRTVATAESCTGGLVAKCLTDVPGSSRYMLNGFITYSNASKVRLLNVPEELLARHGAVSAPVAEAMAVNARRISGSDYALSTTGIAGPEGGSVDKPVGLVYFGLAAEDGCEVQERRLGSELTREEIRERAMKFSLNLLRLRLLRTGSA